MIGQWGRQTEFKRWHIHKLERGEVESLGPKVRGWQVFVAPPSQSRPATVEKPLKPPPGVGTHPRTDYDPT
jgi:hypothetical protein